MLIRTVRKVHKWTTTFLGVFILVWLLSGLAMLAPQPTPDAVVPWLPEKSDYRLLNKPPAEAIRILESSVHKEIHVKSMAFKPLLDKIVYEIRLDDDSTHLVDAQTGSLINITPEIAEKLARSGLKDNVGIAESRLLEKHQISYPWGPLPVYKLNFENGEGTIAYVSASNGAITYTDLSVQLYNAVTATHEFFPLDIFLGTNGQQFALIGVSLASLIIVITGYLLIFSPGSNRNTGDSGRKPDL